MDHQYTSPDAPIKEPNDDIPERFINGCDGDVREARRRWDITRKWRADEVRCVCDMFLFILLILKQNVDTILLEQQPHFGAIKVRIFCLS
jgi:hypothetical protein